MLEALDSYIFVLEKNVQYHQKWSEECKEKGDIMKSYYHSARVDSIKIVINDLKEIFLKANVG